MNTNKKPNSIVSDIKYELQERRKAHLIAQFQEATTYHDEEKDIAKAKSIALYERVAANEDARDKFAKFTTNLKGLLLEDAIYAIFNEAVDIDDIEVGTSESVKRHFIKEFILENGGAIKIIREFKYSSVLLSTIHTKINEAYTSIMEKVDASKPDTITVGDFDRSTFIDNISSDLDVKKLSNEIKLRVSEALNNFLIKKAEEKDYLEDIKSKINTVEEEDMSPAMKESVIRINRAKIIEATTKKPSTVFDAMVHHIVKESLKDAEVREFYSNESGINMDLVLESAVVMYTFLETVHTAKIANIDADYIHEVYTSLIG